MNIFNNNRKLAISNIFNSSKKIVIFNIFNNNRKLVMLILITISVLLYFNFGFEDDKKQDKKVDKRSFLMGLSMFPYDYTQKSIKDTKDFVDNNADAVTIPIENGIPWEEASENKPFPEAINEHIDSVVKNIPKNKEIILNLSPFNEEKKDVADDWNMLGHEKRTGKYSNVEFKDEVVIKAYTNYIIKLTEISDANVIVYAPDVNVFLENSNKLWPDFETFCSKVYKNVKEKFPDKKFIFSIQLDKYYQNESKEKEKLRNIIKYTDYIAVETFPYAFSKYDNPETLPDDYFKKARELDSRKPFAITETAYIAKNLKFDKYNAKGNSNYQSHYMKFVLENTKKENARFICWSVNRDYDELWEIMEENNDKQDEIFEIWKNTGMLDKDGKKRKSYDIWKEYYKKELVNSSEG
ncbi:MAG: hypothetical protein ABF289_20655 [Clostridiales bacterium]